MATMEPEPGVKRELDDSGCVDDESPPAKKPAMSDDSVEVRQINLLDFSDDVLLLILNYCKAIDLKALGFSCVRLSGLVRDRSLWTLVDARDTPTGPQRLRWMIDNGIHEGTLELHLQGYSNQHKGCMGHVSRCQMHHDSFVAAAAAEEADDAAPPGANEQAGPSRANTPYPLQRQRARLSCVPRFSGLPSWCLESQSNDVFLYRLSISPADEDVKKEDKEEDKKEDKGEDNEEPLKCPGPVFTLSKKLLVSLAMKCQKLTTLSLDGCDINCRATPLNLLPITVKKLSLRGTKCYNMPIEKSLFFRVHVYLPHLEELDVSDCEWMEPASLLPLSKMLLLRTLLMRDCPKMCECVAYASLATRYGFRALRILDMRGSPVGDSEVSALGWLEDLEELYLSPITQPPWDTHVHTKGVPLPSHEECTTWELQEPSCISNDNPNQMSTDSFSDSESFEEINRQLLAMKSTLRRDSDDFSTRAPSDSQHNTADNERNNNDTPRVTGDDSTSNKTDRNSDNLATPGPSRPRNREYSATPGPSRPRNGETSATPGPSRPRNGETSATPGPSRPRNGETSATPGPSMPRNGETSATYGPPRPRYFVTSATPGPSRPRNGENSATAGPSRPRNGDNLATPGPSRPRNGDKSDRPGPACSKRHKRDVDIQDQSYADKAYVTITRVTVNLNENNNGDENVENNENNENNNQNDNIGNQAIESTVRVRVTRSYFCTDDVERRDEAFNAESHQAGENVPNNDNVKVQEGRETRPRACKNKDIQYTNKPSTSKASTTDNTSKRSTSKASTTDNTSKARTNTGDASDTGKNSTPVRKSLRNAAKSNENTASQQVPGTGASAGKSAPSKTENGNTKSKGKEKLVTKKQTEKRKAEDSDSEEIEPKRRITRSTVNAGASTSKSSTSKKNDAKSDSSNKKRDGSKSDLDSTDSEVDDEPKPPQPQPVAETIGRFIRFRMQDGYYGCRLQENRPPEVIRLPSPGREVPQERRLEPSHHLLYVNVGERFHTVYRYVGEHRSRHPSLTVHNEQVDARQLVTDAAIRGFGRSDEEDVNYVLIGPHGLQRAPHGLQRAPPPGDNRHNGHGLGLGIPAHRPSRVNLRVLSVTGYPNVTDRSLGHLALTAPRLRSIDLTGTSVTEGGIRQFKALRPECEVITGAGVAPNTEDSENKQ